MEASDLGTSSLHCFKAMAPLSLRKFSQGLMDLEASYSATEVHVRPQYKSFYPPSYLAETKENFLNYIKHNH